MNLKQAKIYSKKTLSIFLAIVMLLMTCSVAFGMSVFAVSDATVLAAEEALAEAIVSSSTALAVATDDDTVNVGSKIKDSSTSYYKYSRTITFDSYDDYVEFENIVTLVMNAADQLVLNNGYGYSSSISKSSSFVRAENIYSIQTKLLSDLSSIMDSLDYQTFMVEDLMDIIFYNFSSDFGSAITSKVYGNSSWTNSLSSYSSTQYGNLYYELILVTDDYVGWLENSDNDATNYSNMKLTTSFTVRNERISASSWGSYVRAWAFKTSGYIQTTGTASTTTADDAFVTAANAYGTYMAEILKSYPDFGTIYDFSQTNSTEFDEIHAQIQSLRLAVVNTLVQGGVAATDSAIAIISNIYDDGDKYADCYDNFDAVEEAESFGSVAESWNAFADQYSSYGTFSALAFDDGAQISSDYTYFQNNIYKVLTSSTESVYKYFVERFELDELFYENFGYNVDAYKVLAMQEAIEETLSLYADVDPDTLDENVKSAIYTALETNLANIEKYDSFIYESFISAEQFETYYNYEAIYATQVNEYVAYFYNLISADLSDYTTSQLINIFCSYENHTSTYSTYLESLKSFYNEIIESAGQDTADSLLSTLITDSQAMLDTGLKYIASIFEGQVAYAYEKYENLGDIDTINWTVALYVDLRASVGSIEENIYDVFDENSIYTSYVDQTTQDQYSTLLTALIPAYNAYAATLGFDTYEDSRSHVTYVDRDVYTSDVVKDEAYEVESSNMTQIIDLLDSLLTDEDILAVLSDLLGLDLNEGENLSTVVIELIEDMLFTDSIINVVVELLYPLVGEQFTGIELPASYTDSTYGTMNLKYLMTMEEIAMAGNEKLAITPASMATFVSQTDYPEVYAALIEADSNWKSTAIYDYDAEAMSLNWGVDAACAAIDAAIADGSYDQTVHGTKLEIFIKAMGTALEGLFPFVDALLCGDAWETGTISDIASTSVTIVVSIPVSIDLVLTATANDGYVNVIGAIYELLGYTDYMSATEVAAYVDNAEDVVRLLFTDLYALIELIFESPVENILDAIPGLVYALTFDTIPNLLSLLKTDITYKATYNASSITSGTAINESFAVDVGEMLDLADMGLDTTKGLGGILELFGINLAIDEALFATLAELTIADTKRTELIYSGTASGKAYHFEADTEGVLYALLTFVLDSVKNGDIYDIIELFGIEKSDIEDIITSLGFGSAYVKTTDMIAAIVELLNPVQYDEVEYFVLNALINEEETYVDANGDTQILPDGYSWDESTQTLVDEYAYLYSDYWTVEQAQYVTNDLTNYISNIAAIFGVDIAEVAGGLIGDLLSDVYTTSTVDSIIELVNDLIGDYLTDETIAMIIDIVDQIGLVDDIDVAAIINHLQNFTYTSFEDGDQAAFIATIVDYIEPLVPVLKLLLVSYDDGSSLSIYGDSIEVYGYNGYESAIVPILEALGCDSAEIIDYDTLVTLDDEAFVEAIINPILALIDSLTSDDLFETLLDILPNILYFIEIGGLNVALTNLLQPVYAVLDTIRPIYNLAFSIDIDLVSIVEGLIKDMGIQDYADISFEELIGAVLTFGESIEKESVVLDADGNAYVYNYVVIAEENYPHLVSIMINYVSSSLVIMENEYIQQAIEVIASLAVLLDEKKYPELVAFLTGLGEVEVKDQAAYLMYYIVYGTQEGIEGFNDLVDGLLDYAGLDEESKKQVVALAAGLINSIASFSPEDLAADFNATFEGIQASLSETFNTIGDNVEDMFTGLQDAADGYVNSAAIAFETALANAQETFANIMENITGSLEDLGDNLGDSAESTSNAFVAFFEELFAKIKSFFDNLFKF